MIEIELTGRPQYTHIPKPTSTARARAEEADEDHHAHHEARLPGALVAEPAYERLHGLGDRLAGFSAHRAAASAPYAF